MKKISSYSIQLTFDNLLRRTENYNGKYYRFIEQIGQGGSANVYSAILKPKNEVSYR